MKEAECPSTSVAITVVQMAISRVQDTLQYQEPVIPLEAMAYSLR